MQDIGLNEFLQPLNSPMTQSQGAAPSYLFDSENERNAVSLSKIKNFSFSAGTGGTLQLGGTANGNGYLYVYNSAGSLIVTINNNGINVTGGSITINNNSGTAVVDPYGINSANVFVNAGAIFSAGQNIPGTAEVSLTGGTLTFITNRNNINYVVLYNADAYLIENVGVNFTSGAFIKMRIDGVAYDPSISLNSGNNQLQTYMAHQLVTLNSGTHNIVLSGALLDRTGTPSMQVGAYKLTYFALGQ